MNKKYLDYSFEIKQNTITEDGVFEGTASDYLRKKDSYGDIIVEGAYTETLKRGGRNGNGIAMLWQHNSNQPIGVYEKIVEVDKKLQVTGKLALGVQQADEAYILAKMGAIKGLSIGWDLARDKEGNILEDAVEIDHKKNIRYLKKIELWEISLVTFPANTRATITNVKAAIEQAKNIREFEHALREEGNLSANSAKYLVALFKPVLEKHWNKNTYAILNKILEIRKQING